MVGAFSIKGYLSLPGVPVKNADGYELPPRAWAISGKEIPLLPTEYGPPLTHVPSSDERLLPHLSLNVPPRIVATDSAPMSEACVYHFAGGKYLFYAGATGATALGHVQYAVKKGTRIHNGTLVFWCKGIGTDPQLAASLYAEGLLRAVLRRPPISIDYDHTFSYPPSDRLMWVNDWKSNNHWRTGASATQIARSRIHSDFSRLMVQGGYVLQVDGHIRAAKIGDVLGVGLDSTGRVTSHLTRGMITSSEISAFRWILPDGTMTSDANVVVMGAEGLTGLHRSIPSGQPPTDFTQFERAFAEADPSNPALSLTQGSFVMVFRDAVVQ